VYRVTCPDRPLLTPVPIAGQPIEKLLDALRQPEDRVRYRARIELSARDSDQVLAAVAKWTTSLDQGDPDYEHQMLEALWLYQQHNVVNQELLARMLRSPDHRARAAATRVVAAWRDRLSEPLELLRVQATDDHPLVRLEAIRAASFFQTSKAAEVALLSLEKPQDNYLKYTLDEALKTLQKYTD
jgi:hypothetical protein